MENKLNAQQKKAWVTPELFNDTIDGTEGKSNASCEDCIPPGTAPGFGYGPS